MANDLKQKTIGGLFWSFVDNFSKLGTQFIVGIILARILSPREFGLIGMLTIFIAISQTFVDGGFRNSLIRKRQCTDADYSTVFYFNLGIAILIYIILFLCAGFISQFFEETQLEQLLKVLGLGIPLSAIGIIHQTILTREINFKLQTSITLAASLGSGVISIIMAFKGFGVWSLVALTVSRFALNSAFLWIWSSWRPSWLFSIDSFKELFSFGSKLLISSLINTIYQNVYLLVIGKYFSANDLGFYTRADQFRNLPSKNITSVIQRVSFPVLSSIQDDANRLKQNYRKLIRSTMFITFLLMMGLVAVAEPLIFALIGEKWEQSVPYLQLLCFVGMFYPLHALNLNMLNVKGRSDLFLKLEIIKKLIAIPVIIIGIFYGIKIMIIGMIFNASIAFLINSYYSGRMIGYSSIQQVLDILPSALFAAAVACLTYLPLLLIAVPCWAILTLQIFIAIILTIAFGEILNFKDYFYLKTVVKEQWSKYRR